MPDGSLHQVIITGLLCTAGPLRIGSGLLPPAGDDEAAPLPLLRDGAGAPVIPGSSLRGWLRRHCPGDANRQERLFGCARRAGAGADADHGRAGALRVYDARWCPSPLVPAPGPVRIALDPVTGTTRPGALFREELTPTGTCFRCRLELARVDEDDLDALLAALRAWDGGADAAIGAGKSRFQGRLHWLPEAERIRTLRRAAWRDWLLADDDLDSRYVDDPRRGATLPALPRRVVPLPGFVLIPESPLLVDAERVVEELNGEWRQVRRFRRTSQTTLLRETTLRGMLRGRARRVLLTLITDRWPDAPADRDRRELADEMLGEVLGGPIGASALHVGAAEANFTEKDIHRQTFVAIDRFSGGAAPQRLYVCEAVMPEAFDWPLALDTALLPPGAPWRRGLLIHLLRDGLDGELAVGWGRARGFGRLRVACSHRGRCFTTWPDLLTALTAGALPWSRDDVETWLDDLDGEIGWRIAMRRRLAGGGPAPDWSPGPTPDPAPTATSETSA